MNENDSTLNNSMPSTGDIIETQEAAVNDTAEKAEKIVNRFDEAVTAQLDKTIPVIQPRNRAERRALKFNKNKRTQARHLDELRKEVQVDAYMNAIKRMKDLREKMEEKLNDSNETDVDV